MNETLSRLLTLMSLLQVRRTWTGAELAERLEVTERTLRRDMARLRDVGFPVEGTAGVAGGYQLRPGATLPPLALSDDEALAVAVALRTATDGAIAGTAEASLGALIKLERVLPAGIRQRANALRSAVTVVDRAGPAPSLETLSALAEATDARREVRFEYAGRDAAPSSRHVEPAGLVHANGRWYLAAFDRDRDDWRTFRVDRVTSAISLGAPFSSLPPPPGGVRAYVERSVAVGGPRTRTRLLLHAPFEVVRPRVGPTDGVLTPRDAETCVLEVGVHAMPALAWWLAAVDVDFEILDPPETLDALRALHARFGRALARADAGERAT